MGLVVDDLLPDYKASLNDAKGVFGDDTTTPTLDENLTRHLNIAARALSADGKRPLIRMAPLAVVAGQTEYTGVPDDLIVPRALLFGSMLKPWQGPLDPIPAIYQVNAVSGPVLVLMPPPTQAQIYAYGSTVNYTYLAAHAITTDPATSTLKDSDKYLVILRAQVEAMREMTFRNIHKPVAMRAASAGASTSNMQPSALYERLLQEYKDAA